MVISQHVLSKNWMEMCLPRGWRLFRFVLCPVKGQSVLHSGKLTVVVGWTVCYESILGWLQMALFSRRQLWRLSSNIYWFVLQTHVTSYEELGSGKSRGVQQQAINISKRYNIYQKRTRRILIVSLLSTRVLQLFMKIFIELTSPIGWNSHFDIAVIAWLIATHQLKTLLFVLI